MTITIQPLSDHEKKLLRRAFKFRVIFAIIFLLPLFSGMILMFNETVDQFSTSTYDGMSFFSIALIVLVCFLVFKYVIPFFINSYKNTKETKKLIISTVVTNIEKQFYRGVRYVVETDYRRIDSYGISILDNIPIFLFAEVYIGMRIEIHCLENNKIDILRIKKV